MDLAQNRKNVMLLSIIAIIVVYVAVSVYGIVRDIGTGQTIFVITSDLPRVVDVERKVPIMDKVRNYFNPPAKVIVPVEKKVTIKGRVVYTNGTPYANGLVELRSEPRITMTDNTGTFIFENVEDGEHTVSVINQSQQVLASCTIDINRDIQIKDAVMVQMADKTFVLEVAVNVKMLEIVLEIQQDDKGQPTGKLVLNPSVIVLEYITEEKIPGEKAPDNPLNNITPVIPLPPTSAPSSNTIDNSGNSAEEEIEEPKTDGELTVYSSDAAYTDFNKPPVPAAAIDIFGSKKHIAPGMSGAYKFTVDNTGNPFDIYYDIDLIESNNSLNIPMKYRLYNNLINAYVNSDSNWHTIPEITAATANRNKPLTMADSMKTEYTLEWRWDDGGLNDNSFAAHGGETACTLTIEVSAQRK